MTPQKIRKSIDEIEGINRRAHRHICDLASGRLKWEMSIPPRQESDSDFVLQAAIDKSELLIKALETMIERLNRLKYKALSDNRDLEAFFIDESLEALFEIVEGKNESDSSN